MTESEAKTKECPLNGIHSRIVGGMMAKDGVPEQILESCLEKSKCIASNCMMWRDHSDETLIGVNSVEVIKADGGYCGLVK